MLVIHHQSHMETKELKANDPKDWKIRSSPIFKLKDKERRNMVIIHLKDFGFIPETIIVSKVRNSNNKMQVHAVLTPEEIKKQEDKKKKIEELNKAKVEVTKPGEIKK
jgi:hypothetical protein